MSSIQSVGGNLPLQAFNTPAKSASSSANGQTPGSTDSVELTGVNQYLQLLKSNNVRADKVSAIKSAIDSNTYDVNGSKLDGAINGLLDDLNA
jgi:anti-sigma28 factor (negative regulator of flagellin synthesis)